MNDHDREVIIRYMSTATPRLRKAYRLNFLLEDIVAEMKNGVPEAVIKTIFTNKELFGSENLFSPVLKQFVQQMLEFEKLSRKPWSKEFEELKNKYWPGNEDKHRFYAESWEMERQKARAQGGYLEGDEPDAR